MKYLVICLICSGRLRGFSQVCYTMCKIYATLRRPWSEPMIHHLCVNETDWPTYRSPGKLCMLTSQLVKHADPPTLRLHLPRQPVCGRCIVDPLQPSAFSASRISCQCKIAEWHHFDLQLASTLQQSHHFREGFYAAR